MVRLAASTLLLISFAMSTLAAPVLEARQSIEEIRAQNRRDADRLNAQKFSRKVGDSCTGEVTCVGTQLGQCVGGKLQATPCSAGTTCQILPLVNKAGTSVACNFADQDTAKAAPAGDANPAAPPKATKTKKPAAAAPTKGASTNTGATDINEIRRLNKEDADRLDAQKGNIKAGSACSKESEVVCAGNQVGQCANGVIVASSCASGTTCQILPLVNKRGTAVACNFPK